MAWLRKGDIDKAIADCDQMIRLDPKDASGYSARGSAWFAKGDFGKSLDDCREAVRLDPKNRALWGLAWIQAASPNPAYRNGKDAVANAERARQLFGLTDPFHTSILAAAYAESGDFTTATRWQMEARDIAPADQKAVHQARLDLFQAQKPFRLDAKR